MKKFVLSAVCALAFVGSVVGASGCSNGDEGNSYELPSYEAVECFRTLGDYFGDITLTEEDGKYYATKPQNAFVVWQGKTYSMAIDLGGIGKGYAADEVKAYMQSQGFEYGYFSFGGSSLSFLNGVPQSSNSGVKEYTLQVIDPRAGLFSTSNYFATTTKNEGVSTSGDYEQYVVQDGVRYCHIINPFTGRPIRTTYDAETGKAGYEAGIASVTIVGGSAAEDDALTTALSVMGKDAAIAFINENLTDRRVVFTYETEAGDIEVYTNIPAGQFTLTNQSYTVKGYGDGNGKIVEEAVTVEAPAQEKYDYLEYVSGSKTGYAMGTDYSCVLSVPNTDAAKTEATNVFNWVAQYMSDVDNSLSVSIKTSSVYRFNAAAAGERVEVDSTCYNVLSLAQSLYTLTGGYYNPAVYFSVDLFGFTPYSLLANSL